MILIAAACLAISTVAVAFVLSGRQRSDLAGTGAVRNAIRFIGGPFPLSVAIHVAVLLFLIITVHESRGRELLMVKIEAGGGGGGGSELQDLELPDVPMPDIAPQQIEQPQTVDTSQAVGLATDYVRAAGGGGIGIGRGGGMGTGYGRGFGNGFGGFIIDLRRKGLDVVMVIDGTGSMKLIIDDVKARMRELVRAIHSLVPTARIGIVVYGGPGESIDVQPLTLSSAKLEAFLGNVQAKGGGEWEEDVLGGLRTAIDRMDWKPFAKKVIVMVGDSPLKRTDFAPIVELIKKFRGENGVLNTVDVAPEEHERFERAFWMKVHREPLQKVSPLPAFAQQTEAAYKSLAKFGGGSMRSLEHDAAVNQKVIVLVFGERWEEEVARYGRPIERTSAK